MARFIEQIPSGWTDTREYISRSYITGAKGKGEC